MVISMLMICIIFMELLPAGILSRVVEKSEGSKQVCANGGFYFP
jgi:hypothetical protein